MRKNIILLLSIAVLCHVEATAQPFEKLSAQLKKYAVVYDSYQHANYPVLTGNTAIGGLADPLGRGVYNIEMNELYLNEKDRLTGPGMMLKIAQFSGLTPASYRQFYNLENGILTTDVAYTEGAYHSELFFSQDEKELMVYTLKNEGQKPLVCNIDFGMYDCRIESRTKTTFYGISPKDAFTCLHYSLQSNIPFETFTPYAKDVFLYVPPGETLEIIARLKVTPTAAPQAINIPTETAPLFQNHIRRWHDNWQAMGIIILPEGEYAKAFYRSLHWLQCTAGAEKNLPGESQFGMLSSKIAAEYHYQGNASLNHSSWYQLPFTYGGAGWATYAYTLLGDKERAGKMLSNFYRPESLKKNVKLIVPVGEHEFTYNHKPKGRYEYLSHDNPDAMCFAHENMYDQTNHVVPPWDKQVHVQGFAPSMFYHYNRLYAEKEDTAYAVMKGSAEFWHTLLHYDSNQKSYTLPPLLSLTEDLFEANTLDGLIAAKWTLAQAALMAKKRNTDKLLRDEWAHIAQHIRIKDRNNVYLEFNGDDGSRAGAGYMGIRGYAYLGFPTLETMKNFSPAIVNQSLDQCWLRNKKGEGMITFIANWFALTDAYWGRAEEAYEKSAYCLTQLDPSGTAMCEQNGMLYYFLTGYASFVTVPVSMVLQSIDNDIKVFPAVPKAFADIEFYNLPAENGIRVSGIMKNGKTQRVWFEKDGKTLLESTGKEKVCASWSNNRLIVKKP
ncbi:MAG: hypothetical protein LBT48_02160 [Prevotellaceae bacterium]|jgi:hypothetical protein|nr:hypothetical protein [Prevotellaceae bacterium]